MTRFIPLIAFANVFLPFGKHWQNAGKHQMITSFIGAPVYDISLTHNKWLSVVSCGFKGKLVRLLSLGVGHHFVPQTNTRSYNSMMHSIARRVASKKMAAVRDEAAKEAEELCASGQCAAAFVLLQLAIELGHLPSRALMAWLLINCRKGVTQNPQRGFELAKEGVRLGCHHCQGVLAHCLKGDFFSRSTESGLVVNKELSLQLARESSEKDSKYGKLVWGKFCLFGEAEQNIDIPKALKLLTSAAAQGLEEAQISIGYMYEWGIGVRNNYRKALQFYHLAVAQGNPVAMCRVASCYERGHGVKADKAEAIRWYRLSLDAGYLDAAKALLRLEEE